MTDVLADLPQDVPLDELPTAPVEVDPAAPMRLYLVDGSGYIFRAFHALPPLTRKTDGLPVGAVSGFCNMLWKFLGDMKSGEHDLKGPTHLAVVFDASEKTFRSTLYPEYKAHRPPPPEDLVPQFALVREATRAFGVPCVELEGYEADDLIATYATQVAEAGGEVVIVSSDKDLMQLVNEQVCLLEPVKNVKICRDQVIEKFGLGPEKVIEIQALAGDSVDNVPGAPGIGIKTAAALLAEFGDLDTLLEQAHTIKQPKRRETLMQYADQVRLSRELVKLATDVPLPTAVADLAIRDFDAAVLGPFLESMEFRGLARRVNGGQTPTSPPTPPHAGGFAGRAPAGSRPSSAADAIVIDPAKHLLIQDETALETLIAAAFEAGKVGIAVQTDSACGENGVYGVAIAVAPGQSAYVPLGHCPSEGLSLDSSEGWGQITPPVRALELLKPLLEDRSVLKVGHNIKASIRALSHAGITLAPYDDILLISYALEGGLHGHTLENLAQRWLDHEPISWKSVVGTGQKTKAFAQVELSPAAQFAAQEPDLVLRLHRLLKPRLVREGMTTVYETLERPLPAVLAAMENAGVLVDPHTLRRLSHEFGALMAKREAEAHELAGHRFNLGSPKQIGDVLFGEQGLPGGRRTATGAWSTDADTLEALGATGAPLPLAILEHRQIAKLKNTYTDSLLVAAHPRDGRVRTTYVMGGSSTGRLAATDPNLQNIPIRTDVGRQLRTVFIAAPGNCLISADYSQIELRLLAHVGDIPQLKAAFAAGQDIHAATASEMFGVPVEGMPSQVRSRAKAINFGIVYGISAFGLSNQLGIPQDEAGAYIKTYFERFPGIKAYMDEARAFVREHGYVQTLFGRKIHIPDIRAHSVGQRQAGERQAINAPIQGAAADIIRRAMARMPAALEAEGLKAKMLLQVHDELVFEAPTEEADKVCEVARRIMSRAAEPAVSLTVPLDVDARAAKNWDEAH